MGDYSKAVISTVVNGVEKIGNGEVSDDAVKTKLEERKKEIDERDPQTRVTEVGAEVITKAIVKELCQGITREDVKIECYKGLCPWADSEMTWEKALNQHSAGTT